MSGPVVSGDGKQVVSGSEDKTVRVWDVGGRGAEKVEGHTGGVWSVSFSGDGKQVVSGSRKDGEGVGHADWQISAVGRIRYYTCVRRSTQS